MIATIGLLISVQCIKLININTRILMYFGSMNSILLNKSV